MKNYTRSIAALFVLIISAFNLQAQEGVLIDYVGTTRDNSAVLDIRSANQGVMVPRVDLDDINDNVTIPNPATSLLVYNQVNAGTAPNSVTPGYCPKYQATWASMMRLRLTD